MTLARCATNSPNSRSEPFLQALGDRAKLSVDLARGAAQDQVADRVSGQANVREGAKNVHAILAQRDTRARGVFDGVLGLTIFTSNTADTSRKVVPLETLDIF